MSRIYRLSYLSHTAGGVLLVNDLHYKVDVPAAGSEPPVGDVIDSVDTHLTTTYRSCLSVNYTVDSLDARQEVTPGSGDVPVAGSKSLNVAGTLAAADTKLPIAMTAILGLRTAAATRSGRGYIAVPSPQGSGYLDSVGGWLQSGSFWTNLGALAALLDDSITMGGAFPPTLVPVVYSRTRASRGIDPVSFDVTSAKRSAKVKWRRSRTTAP